MASSKVMSRLCSRLQPLSLKLTNNKTSFFFSPGISLIKSSSQSQARRFSRLNSKTPLPLYVIFLYIWKFSLYLCGVVRLPVELSSLETMMPLHSAIASARLQSSLSIEPQSWCLVPQGLISFFFYLCIFRFILEIRACYCCLQLRTIDSFWCYLGLSCLFFDL